MKLSQNTCFYELFMNFEYFFKFSIFLALCAGESDFQIFTIFEPCEGEHFIFVHSSFIYIFGIYKLRALIWVVRHFSTISSSGAIQFLKITRKMLTSSKKMLMACKNMLTSATNVRFFNLVYIFLISIDFFFKIPQFQNYSTWISHFIKTFVRGV